MTRLPAFAVDGAVANGRLFRTVSYASTSGEQGIVTPDSMKVTANGANVDIAPGAAVAPTRYVDSPAFNSYVMAADAVESVPIPATGAGGGATRYIIARVDDPEHGGQGDAQKIFWRYEQVSSITNLPYPFVPLARVDQPASTSSITAGMITDLRQVATPRSRRGLTVAVGTSEHILTAGTYTAWPSWADKTLQVPSWASTLYLRADISGARLRVGAFAGKIKARVGNIDSREHIIDLNYASGEGSSRHDLSVVDVIDVTEKRGVEAIVRLWAHRTNGTGELSGDTYTSVTYDYEFVETPI